MYARAAGESERRAADGAGLGLVLDHHGTCSDSRVVWGWRGISLSWSCFLHRHLDASTHGATSRSREFGSGIRPETGKRGVEGRDEKREVGGRSLTVVG